MRKNDYFMDIQKQTFFRQNEVISIKKLLHFVCRGVRDMHF